MRSLARRRRPIRDWSEIYRPLDERVLEGFGGVSEYGITVRWDKNFLTLLHLTLARRRGLRMYGGVRFGGTLPIEDAWTYGFDHVAIATGAGRPTIIDMKNNLIRGIRKASDFLMALQLTGAFKREALPNLQARLPAVVIGGGLTAIDTATELMAYYPLQVEKIAAAVRDPVAGARRSGVARVVRRRGARALDEYRAHGAGGHGPSGRAPSARAAPPDFVPLVRGWGGVTIAYRKRMVDSPAYRLNHEEVIKALEEGIVFAENLNPDRSRARRARRGQGNDLQARGRARPRPSYVEAEGQRSRWSERGSGPREAEMPTRSRCRRGRVLVAAGTTPNITCEKEAPGTFQLDAKKKFFQPHSVVAERRRALSRRARRERVLHVVFGATAGS